MIGLKWERNNHVLLVSSNPQVSELLYEFFGSVPELNSKYYIEGAAATREAAIDIAKTKCPGTIIFFEKTAGIATISHTMYTMRMTGARIIYISSDRYIGDPILETIVSYGIYDIILADEMNLDLITDYMLNPRDFNDVSIFKREYEIADQGGGEKGFKLPELDRARQFSIHMDTDYLVDPMQRAVNKITPNINRQSEKRGVSSVLYKEVDKDKAERAKISKAELLTRKQKLAQQKAQENKFEVPDFDW